MKKKLITCISILVMGLSAFGQDSNTHDNNELRLNLGSAIFGLPEINYERYIAENMGVGLAAAFSVDKPEDMTTRYVLLPYYRIYFGSKKASGFFIEGNMALVGQHDAYSYANYTGYFDETLGYYVNPGQNTTSYSKSATNFGFGAAFGFKFLTRNGVIGEICIGGGRLYGNPIVDAFPRLGVCIGKRF